MAGWWDCSGQAAKRASYVLKAQRRMRLRGVPFSVAVTLGSWPLILLLFSAPMVLLCCWFPGGWPAPCVVLETVVLAVARWLVGKKLLKGTALDFRPAFETQLGLAS